jgi:hypothetical protein
MTRDLLAGRLGRVTERKRITEDGVAEPIRIHHPGPRARRRPLRFVPS